MSARHLTFVQFGWTPCNAFSNFHIFHILVHDNLPHIPWSLSLSINGLETSWNVPTSSLTNLVNGVFSSLRPVSGGKHKRSLNDHRDLTDSNSPQHEAHFIQLRLAFMQIQYNWSSNFVIPILCCRILLQHRLRWHMFEHSSLESESHNIEFGLMDLADRHFSTVALFVPGFLWAGLPDCVVSWQSRAWRDQINVNFVCNRENQKELLSETINASHDGE
jgi:hypothetical protein